MTTEDYRDWVERACHEDIRRRKLSYGGGTQNRMPSEAFKRWLDACALRTGAEDHGDHYLINGSKIWISNPHVSDWIFCLVRTDQDAPKQQGISFLLFSLDTPGVTVRNFDLINGGSDFCEAFFDNVKVLKNDLVGRGNDGWTIAKRLLQHERNSVSKGEFLPQGGSLPLVLKHYTENDPAARENVLRIGLDDAAFQLTKMRAVEEATVAMMGALGLGCSGDGSATKSCRQRASGCSARVSSLRGAAPKCSAISSPNVCWVCPTNPLQRSDQ